MCILCINRVGCGLQEHGPEGGEGAVALVFELSPYAPHSLSGSLGWLGSIGIPRFIKLLALVGTLLVANDNSNLKLNY